MAKEKPTTKTCKHCKTEIPFDAKVCPQCRKKQGGGILKWIVIAIVALIVISAVASGGGSSSEGGSSSSSKEDQASNPKEEQAIEYTAYSVSEMMDDLDANAMSAADKYKGQYVEVTGKLNVIDSDGKYISLDPVENEFTFFGVTCYIKNDETKQAVYDMSIDDIVTVRGKITDVGEVMGYSLDIDEVV